MASKTVDVKIVVDTTVIHQEFWELWLSAVRLVLTREFHKIRAHVDDELPNECVGLVWNDGIIQRLRNQADSPDRFSISRTQLATKLVEREATEDIYLLAFYHSHPGGATKLSSTDLKSFKAQHSSGLQIPWLVVTDDEARLWYMVKENGEHTDEVESFFIECNPTKVD